MISDAGVRLRELLYQASEYCNTVENHMRVAGTKARVPARFRFPLADHE